MSRQSLNAALLLAMLAAPLAACTADGPWPLPTGYYYENGKYKAPPGPEPMSKHIETEHLAPDSLAPVSATTTTTTTAVTTNASTTTTEASGDVGALVSRLFGDFGKPAEPVWIQPAAGGAFLPVLDAKLRAALADQGIKVTDGVGNGPFGVRYTVAPGDGGQSIVTLDLTSGGMKAAEASGPVTLSGGAADTPVPLSRTHEAFSSTRSETTTSATGLDSVPAGPVVSSPASAGAPTPLPPMRVND